MNILVLGSRGMAGHVIASYLKENTKHQVICTTRDKSDAANIYLDARDETRLKEILHSHRPDIVVNAVGLLNQNASDNRENAIRLNSLLPHRIANITESYGGRLIHISTDCVFSGNKGNYDEDHVTDGHSVYAKTKALGEIRSNKHLTIRTSIIGPDLKDGIGLFQWFMKQEGMINGFNKVYWNGVTTLELAKAISVMIDEQVTGLYHLASPEKVSKYDLLKMIQDTFEKQNVTIRKEENHRLDRTLKNTRTDFQYRVPAYSIMLKQLKQWIEKQ